jgi:chromosome segregation ATPase
MKKRGKKIKVDGIFAKKLKHEQIAVIALISVVVVLAIVLGYDMYTTFKERTAAETRINSLNSTIVSLNEERDQLILNNSNLILEIEGLNQTVKNLNQQRTVLISENNDLASDLAALQTDYDALEADLQDTEDELAACQAGP